jgi:hypothetical protein
MTTASKPQPVMPADWEFVKLIPPECSPTLATMVEIQYLTGMRSANLTAMCAREIHKAEKVWLYLPAVHKTAWKERPRTWVWLGAESMVYLAVDR